VPTIDQTELGFLYPIETVIAETEKPETETKKQTEMKKCHESETDKSELKKSTEMKKSSEIENLAETEKLLAETEKSAEPETKKPEIPKQRPSTLSYSQPMNAPVIVCSSASLEQIIVQVSVP
jgi:hypothetical protein